MASAGCACADIPKYVKVNSTKILGYKKRIREKIFKSMIRTTYRQNKSSMKKIVVDCTTILGKKVEKTVMMEIKRLQTRKFTSCSFKRTASINYDQSCKQSRYYKIY